MDFDKLAAPLVQVYEEVTDQILENIARHFNTGKALPTIDWQMRKLAEMGQLRQENIRIIAVTGEDPAEINDKHISFTVTGTITGSTANTITVQTDDGAVDTFRIENAQDLTEGGVEYGDYVCVTFHPSKSKSSNIYTAIKIQNA